MENERMNGLYTQRAKGSRKGGLPPFFFAFLYIEVHSSSSISILTELFIRISSSFGVISYYRPERLTMQLFGKLSHAAAQALES